MTLKKKLLCFLCLLFVFSVTLTGCSKDKKAQESSEESTPEIVDDGEYPVTIRGVEIPSRPDRVASLADSLTEKIYDLGLQHNLVAVSTYCDFPAPAADLPRAGTSQIPDVNVIQETGATVILTTAPLAATDAQTLESRGVQVIVIPQAQNLAEIWTVYEEIAMALDGKTVGKQLAEEKTAPAKAWLESLRTAVAGAKTEEIPALYLKKLDFTVATGDSVEHEIMELLGLSNIAGDKVDWSYPELEAKEGEGLADFKQIAMILMDERDVTIKMLETSEFYKPLPATLGDKYVYLNSIALERQSFSMLEEISVLAHALWADADLPAWTGGDSGFADSDVPDSDVPDGDLPDGDLPDGDDTEIADT